MSFLLADRETVRRIIDENHIEVYGNYDEAGEQVIRWLAGEDVKLSEKAIEIINRLVLSAAQKDMEEENARRVANLYQKLGDEDVFREEVAAILSSYASVTGAEDQAPDPIVELAEFTAGIRDLEDISPEAWAVLERIAAGIFDF